MPRKATKRGKKQAPPAKKPAKKTKKDESSENESASGDESPVVVTPAAATAKPAAAAVVVVAAPVVAPPAAASTPQKSDKNTLSDDAKQTLGDLAKTATAGGKVTPSDLNSLNVTELKLALKLNDRPTTGNRGDLVKAICENMKLGCPPRCSDCGGGRLRFGPRKGKKQFWCPGYMEDDEFVNCGFTAEDGEVDRTPWISP